MTNRHRSYNGFYVKHLPRNNEETADLASNRLVISEVDLISSGQYLDWPALTARSNEYDEKGNPVYALEAFVLCHKAGIYPPLNVLDWLSNAFEEWHKSNGTADMSKCLGLTPNGGPSPMRRAIDEQREQDLMIEFHKLKNWFSITNIQAAEMIAARLERTDWDKTGLRLSNCSPATLVDKYERKWAKMFNDSDVFIDILAKTGLQEKLDALSNYPQDSYMHVKNIADLL